MNLEKGGRGAIERMVEAYGFKTRQALCDHLGISKSTLATRYMRDSFPAEWVIQCALETAPRLIGSQLDMVQSKLQVIQILWKLLNMYYLMVLYVKTVFIFLIRDFYPLRLKNLLSSQITILNLFVIKNLMIYVMVNG